MVLQNMVETRATIKDVSTNISGDHSTVSIWIIVSIILSMIIITTIFLFTRHNHKIVGSKSSVKIIKHFDICEPVEGSPDISEFCTMSGVTTCSFIPNWSPIKGNPSGYGAMICPSPTPDHSACQGLCSSRVENHNGVWECPDTSEDIFFKKCIAAIKPQNCNSTSTQPIGTGIDNNVYFINKIGHQKDICGNLNTLQPEGDENI
jgi:hypothetical protein